MTFLLNRDDIAGPVNIVGPRPATNAEFTKALGGALHRPAVMPVPGIALRVLLGEMVVEALRSLRVLPGVTEPGRLPVPAPGPERGTGGSIQTRMVFSSVLR